MVFRYLSIPILLLGLIMVTGPTWAQDPPRFPPPRPPSMDPNQDYEDPMDEDFEMGDGPNRIPPPPPPLPPTGNSGNMGSTPDFQSPSSNSSGSGSGGKHSAEKNKIRFKIVDGKYYEKGKPRGRTQKYGVPFSGY